MSEKLVACRDYKTGNAEYVDIETGDFYADPQGVRKIRSCEPTDYLLGERNGTPVRDENGKMIHIGQLAMCAADHYHTKVAEQLGHPVRFRVSDEFGRVVERTARPKERLVTMRDKDGRLVAMDLGVGDVHTPSAIPFYVGGYHITDGIADVVSPVVPTPKQADVYYTWNSDNDFKRKIPNGGAPGATVPVVNPTLGSTSFATQQFSLGGILPTEIMANADTPLRPAQKLMQMVVDGLRLEREIRTQTLLQTSGSWNANLVTTIAAGAQWDAGPAADPVANLHHAIEQSYLPVTGIAWSEIVEHDFIRNPAVQKYFAYKDQVNGLPDPQKLSSVLRLPPIHTAMMKYVTGGALQYVWGNHVVLLHQPSEMPPTSQMEVATSITMRWAGGDAPDGRVGEGGFLVRQFFDPFMGPRGSTRLVVAHNDIELMTSGLVGGLLLNAHQ